MLLCRIYILYSCRDDRKCTPLKYVTLEHKTSQFFEIEIYASSESWINNISIDVWFGQYLKIWNLRVQKHLNIEKIIFKVVQMKFLAMHINNQVLIYLR